MDNVLSHQSNCCCLDFGMLNPVHDMIACIRTILTSLWSGCGVFFRELSTSLVSIAISILVLHKVCYEFSCLRLLFSYPIFWPICSLYGLLTHVVSEVQLHKLVEEDPHWVAMHYIYRHSCSAPKHKVK